MSCLSVEDEDRRGENFLEAAAADVIILNSEISPVSVVLTLFSADLQKVLALKYFVMIWAENNFDTLFDDRDLYGGDRKLWRDQFYYDGEW